MKVLFAVICVTFLAGSVFAKPTKTMLRSSASITDADLKVKGNVLATAGSPVSVHLSGNAAETLYKQMQGQGACEMEDSTSEWCQKAGTNINCWENSMKRPKVVRSYHCEMKVDSAGKIQPGL